MFLYPLTLTSFTGKQIKNSSDCIRQRQWEILELDTQRIRACEDGSRPWNEVDANQGFLGASEARKRAVRIQL